MTTDSDPPESTPPGATPLDYDDLDDTGLLAVVDPHELTAEQRARRKAYLRDQDRRHWLESYIRRIGWRAIIIVAIAATGPIIERVLAWVLR